MREQAQESAFNKLLETITNTLVLPIYNWASGASPPSDVLRRNIFYSFYMTHRRHLCVHVQATCHRECRTKVARRHTRPGIELYRSTDSRLQQLCASQAGRVAIGSAAGKEARLARRHTRPGIELEAQIPDFNSSVLVRQEE